MKAVCFIGHSNCDTNKIQTTLNTVIQQLIDNEYTNFYVGTHGDFDSCVLNMLKQFRKLYKNIKIFAVMTSFSPLIKKNDSSGKIYSSDFELCSFEIEEIHFKRQIIVSNQKMIDLCDTLVCYVDELRNYSGAKLALKYAKHKQLRIINLFM